MRLFSWAGFAALAAAAGVGYYAGSAAHRGPAVMPYLTDDDAPATLPPLGDVPAITPIPVTPPDPDHPLLRAVKKFFEGAADVTDKVPLGKPPVSEHPSAVAPKAVPRPHVD